MPRHFTHEDLTAPENQRTGQVHTRSRREREPLRCRGCGNENTIVAYWSETSYGTANVLNHDVELDSYETHESNNFEVSDYRCLECDLESGDIYGVALNIDEEFEE